jgi:hypothetical protein
VIRRVLLLTLCALALTACRLDVDVSVVMEPDGTGEVTVDAVADAELVGRVPGLADDLRFDDAIANGWVIDGPTATDDGGLSISMSHDFFSAAELASVLNSIGPPLTQMAAARTPQDDQTSNAINGQLVMPNGFESFADADLLAAVGGLPFGDEITASGLTPDEAMSFTFSVSLPGELVSAETGTETADGAIEWEASLDGTDVNLYTLTVQRPADAVTNWAGPLSTVSLFLLIAWVVLAVTFITFVAFARRNKRRRRERALRDPDARPQHPTA